MRNSSIAHTHTHDNIAVIDEFSESDSGELLYKGAAIKGTGGGSSTVTISPNANNALSKLPNGYYVPAVLISALANNALQKYSDGYYVPALPANNATTDDIDDAVDIINDSIANYQQIVTEQHNTLITKVEEIKANTTKQKTHKYTGNTVSMESIVDVSTLYSISSNVILSIEFLVINNSSTENLNIQVKENGIITMECSLLKSENQKYRLSSIPQLEILAEGSYTIYLYVNYL